MIAHVGEGVGWGDTRPLLVKVQLVQSLWKAKWRMLRKVELDLPAGSSYPTLGHIPKGCFLHPTTDSCSVSNAALLITAQDEHSLDAHQGMNVLKYLANLHNVIFLSYLKNMT